MKTAFAAGAAILASTALMSASPAGAADAPTCTTHKTTAIVASDTGGLDSVPNVQTYIWTNSGQSTVPAGTSWPFVVNLDSNASTISAPGLTFSNGGGIVSAKAFGKVTSSTNPNDPRHRVRYDRAATERFTLTHDLAPGEQVRLNVTATGLSATTSLNGVVHGSSSVVSSSANACDTVNTRVTIAPSYLG